jgi:hypothetical protein
MLERLDYELITPDTAAKLLATKDGQKYLIAFASTTSQSATRPNDLTQLRADVMTHRWRRTPSRLRTRWVLARASTFRPKRQTRFRAKRREDRVAFWSPRRCLRLLPPALGEAKGCSRAATQ